MWILLFLFNVSATNPWARKRCVLLSGFDTIYSCIQKLLNGYEIEIQLVIKVLLNILLDFTSIKICFIHLKTIVNADIDKPVCTSLR